ncbi:hypothetical protein T4C_6699 [Trichinella pseudospiralis]|uniref:Uncharacterized protein n=1 Tax=Trichinella pseudospiralis TaxID=6337 RepID=A0A0V1JC03_TRIPS|nr:hypothetical protein T4C_6699 [Trichinella pseudospiralis]
MTITVIRFPFKSVYHGFPKLRNWMFVFIFRVLLIAFIFIVKMSDVPEKNIDSLIKFDSTDSSLTGSNSESFQEVLDSSEVSSLNTESSKTDSTLGSTCLTGEYTKVEIPMQDAKQCYVLNYKLRTPGGKVYDYSGPFPPDPNPETLQFQKSTGFIRFPFKSVYHGFPKLRNWMFVKMSDVPEKNIDSLIKFDSTDSSLTGSNSESFQEVLDSSEVSSLNTESSKTDSTLGSTCLTGEYTKVEIPMQDAKQCYVLNYKLRTPGGKVYDYSGPFPPDPNYHHEVFVLMVQQYDLKYEIIETCDNLNCYLIIFSCIEIANLENHDELILLIFNLRVINCAVLVILRIVGFLLSLY